ncbi:Golgi-associated RAB2 interactor protein 1A-like isoform X2 [Hemicordylus capensis]|nr:Golgi-associated RAB2 interactor protein 1A-like isoform X2 [Hemicordylus capensis]XP_053116526.1 Golgi-associated RAB2 interactor protein 1A-like isoform X2 [Hemicordylus capensis]XP_053116527.1 Golgi-associated RAB2 interactor protein 1A-like isoform X2 [Hemicordylus capensis]XP_053116528.1 Golgi-associated RAB2 interactor protein 1A-like isoform X2 [Hemicordylus capensis]
MPSRGINQRRVFFNKIGPLQRQLRQGEYGLFRFSPMFESNFVQISKQGGPIEIHNQEQIVTVGITSTSPAHLIPNVLLLARPIVLSEEHLPFFKAMRRYQKPVRYELTRLFPLRFVKITVHNAERQQLRFKLASGRTFYLQLCAESDRRDDLFDAWVRIIQLLRPASDVNVDEPKEKPRAPTSHVTSLPLQTNIPSPRHISPQHMNATWNIHAATKSVSALENKTKKKQNLAPEKKAKKKQSPAPEKKAKKKQSPVPSPESTVKMRNLGPPSSSVEVVLGDSLPAIENLKTSKRLETVPEVSSTQEGQAEEKVEHESNPLAKRKPKKSDVSRSRSGQQGTSRKPSKIISLIRACSWGKSRKGNRSGKARNKGKKH